MKLIKDTEISKVYEDDNTIVKIMSRPYEFLNWDWYHHYCAFQSEYLICPKIHHFVPKREIHMEKVDGQEMKHFILKANAACKGIHKKTYIDCFKIIQEIKYFMADYSQKNGIFCIHADISVDNIMMKSAHSYQLVDIDSFRFNWGFHMYQYNTAEGWLMCELLADKIGKGW